MPEIPGAPRSDDDAFYVGYLALPRGHARFLRVVVPLGLWMMVFMGFALVWPQRSPGSGAWETGMPLTREGVLLAEPYPMLIEAGGRVTLLTEMGKRGAQERVHAFAGRQVRIEGYRIHRDGREIMELVPGEGAITLVGGREAERDGFAARLEGAGEVVTLRGEILDSKCYLGAMRPGDGAGHRACAMLCIRGGIAPMLYSVDADGGARYDVVVDAKGGRIDESVIALVGMPVSVRGRAMRVGDLGVMFVEAGGVSAGGTHQRRNAPTR